MNTLDRRTFLASFGALVVGFSWAGSAAAAAAHLAPAKAVDKARIESFVAITGDGRATVYVGKVDLGNGSRTALMQLAAAELDMPFDRITMVMGDTATTPDPWLTGASTTIAQGGMELRRACATARAALLARGAAKLGLAADDASCRDGVVFSKSDPARRVAYGELAGSAPLELAVDPKVVPKKPADYQWIGKPIARVDIPGMLHARVLRPGTVGASLLSVDDSKARTVDGFVRTVRKGDFLAVLARTEWGAIKAMRTTKAIGVPPSRWPSRPPCSTTGAASRWPRKA